MSMRELIDEAKEISMGWERPIDGGITKARIGKMADAMMSPRLMSEIKRVAKAIEKNDAWGGSTEIGQENWTWEEALARSIRARAVDAIVVALTENGISTTTSLRTSARKSSRAVSKNLR